MNSEIGLTILMLWFICINALGINIMVKDKMNSSSHGWRVKESTIFWIAFLLGALSIYACMQAMRHKTKKFFFRKGIPMLILENFLVIVTIISFLL